VYRHLRIGNPRALKSTIVNIEVNVLIELEGRIYLGNQAFRGKKISTFVVCFCFLIVSTSRKGASYRTTLGPDTTVRE
jgi:hypothetical protein